MTIRHGPTTIPNELRQRTGGSACGYLPALVAWSLACGLTAWSANLDIYGHPRYEGGRPILPRSDMGARLSGRGSGSGWFPGQDAEFVAFGIGERDPAAAIGPPVVGLLRGPEREDPLGLLLASAIYRPQVQVHAVLHRLAIRQGFMF